MLSDEAIASLADQYLKGEIGAIELSNELEPVWDLLTHISADRARPFEIFSRISDEARGLPVGSPRQFWKPEALQEVDKDIVRIENKHREEVTRRCRELIVSQAY
jgi:hypothetical protein